MSNEIIRLCCHSISLDRIFEGYVSSSKEDLQGCISCCHAWKDHYLRAVQMHTQYDGPLTSVFILDVPTLLTSPSFMESLLPAKALFECRCSAPSPEVSF